MEKKSIVFIAENDVDITSVNLVTKGTCAGKPMTMAKGIVYCYSVNYARSRRFRWWYGVTVPDFDPANCNTAKRGNFLDVYLEFT